MTTVGLEQEGRQAVDGARRTTVVGLGVSAAGIGVLWASGVPFPVYPPPGILILGAGAVFVALAPWRWVPAVGVGLGLFIATGFVISGLVKDEGFATISGAAGPGAVVGTLLQLGGAALAVAAGAVALRRAARHARGTAGRDGRR